MTRPYPRHVHLGPLPRRYRFSTRYLLDLLMVLAAVGVALWLFAPR